MTYRFVMQNRPLVSARMRTRRFRRAALLLGVVALTGAAAPAAAQTVLVNSIIDSTKTDNPPRFCWNQQYVNDKGEWVDALPGSLDDFRNGHLDFGPNFDETNIVVDHWGIAQRPIRLQRIKCPPPAPPEHGMMPGGTGLDGEMLAVRLEALIDDPDTRAQLEALDKHRRHGGLFDNVSVGIGVGVEAGGGDHGHDDHPKHDTSPHD